MAETFTQRSRGLLGKSSYEGAMVLPRTRAVHTFGMRMAIDVAVCDKDLTVLGVTTLRPYRMSLSPARGPLDHRGPGRCVRAVGPPGRGPPGAAGVTDPDPIDPIDPDILEELEFWTGPEDAEDDPGEPGETESRGAPTAGSLVVVGTPIGNLG